VEQALATAGLGDAIHRPVRTYSQGMRQRLAIAQAMLGDPDLLVLDEPTNGLDPPQIRHMRDLLHRIAADGRTVLLSSHLLAEVEQTCTHVVVMDHGRLVAAGLVAELLAAGGGVRVDVPAADVATAERVAAAVPGVLGVHGQPGGIVVELDGVPRSTLVAALVAAGVPVDGMASRRRLEDVFLHLVGEPER
jgi:ABC-2 type transport system ATP-binding protein